MSVPFSSVLLLRKSPNFVRDPVSPASLSLGASASSKACKRPPSHFKAWPDDQHARSSLTSEVKGLSSVEGRFPGHLMAAVIRKSMDKHRKSSVSITHIKELLALDLPHELHHQRLCECAIHQR